jgi:hypothetical protein
MRMVWWRSPGTTSYSRKSTVQSSARSARSIVQQHPEGYWQAALEAHSEMNAEYIVFNRFMELQPVCGDRRARRQSG